MVTMEEEKQKFSRMLFYKIKNNIHISYSPCCTYLVPYSLLHIMQKASSKSRLSMSRVRNIRKMRRESGDMSPITIRTYQIPESDIVTSLPPPSPSPRPRPPPPVSTNTSHEDVARELEVLSIEEPPVFDLSFLFSCPLYIQMITQMKLLWLHHHQQVANDP